MLVSQVTQVTLTGPAESGWDEEEDVQKEGLRPLAHVRDEEGVGGGGGGEKGAVRKERGTRNLLKTRAHANRPLEPKKGRI